MKHQKLSKKSRTHFLFRKKFILMGSVSLVAIFLIVFFVKATGIDLSASVLNLSKISSNKSFTTKKDVKVVKSTGDSCFDSDGGTDHAVK